MPPDNPKQPRFRLVIRCLLALGLGLGIWEILLRSFFVPIPYHHDPQLGWMPKPFSHGMVGIEGRAECRYNERGFRDGPIDAAIPGQLRILCLGDSFTEAPQIAVEHTFPLQLQSLLRERADASVRVYNSGRSGTSVPYTLGFASAYREIFHPDWVVILVRDGWDQAFDRTEEIFYEPIGDSFEIKQQWHWYAMSSALRTLIEWHIRDFAVFQLGKRQFQDIVGHTTQPATPAATAAVELQRELRAIDFTVEHWRIEYPQLVIVHIPFGAAAIAGLLPPSPEEQALAAACQRRSVAFISMRDVIEQDARVSDQPPFGFFNTIPWAGHPNKFGHQLIAKALADFFLDGKAKLQAKDPR